MVKQPRMQEKPKHTTNVWVLLLITLFMFGVAGLFSAGVSRLNGDLTRLASSGLHVGTVLGAQTQKQEATFAITGGGVDRHYDFDLTGRTTAYDLLNRASSRDAFPLNVKQYDFGVFIEGIDGVKGSAKKFWAFYVNGQQAQVGADSYVVKPGDQIEFKLEAIK